jgi:hypothetical protein
VRSAWARLKAVQVVDAEVAGAILIEVIETRYQPSGTLIA